MERGTISRKAFLPVLGVAIMAFVLAGYVTAAEHPKGDHPKADQPAAEKGNRTGLRLPSAR